MFAFKKVSQKAKETNQRHGSVLDENHALYSMDGSHLPSSLPGSTFPFAVYNINKIMIVPPNKPSGEIRDKFYVLVPE